MIDLKRDLAAGRRRRAGPGDHRRTTTRRTCGSPCSNSFDGDGVAPLEPRHPGQAAGRRRGAAGLRACDRTVRTTAVPRHRSAPAKLQVALAADAVPGRLGRRARATGATTGRRSTSSAPPTTRPRPDLLPAERPRRCARPRPAARRRDAGAGVGVHPEHRAARATCPRRCARWPSRSPTGKTHEVRAGRGAAAVVPRRRRLPLLPGAPAGNGTDDLVAVPEHGQDGRVGYCEQFAAAMALMGRTLGHPLAGRGRVPASGPVGPRHLRLQHPRPARLAGDVLRRRRLGALRADPAATAPAACRRTPPSRCRAARPARAARRPAAAPPA